jgi:hypothetical protein
MERQHPDASFMHISSAHGAPEAHRAPSVLRLDDGDAAHRRDPSLARSRHVGNHNACPTQGVGCPGPNWAGKDQLHYRDSDPDNHGQHHRVRDARRSLSSDAYGPQAFTKKIR